MTKSQKLAVRASEIRSRLNELNGNPELSDDDRAEMAKLGEEYGNVETEWRGATIAETDELETRTTFDDAKDRERRDMVAACTVGAIFAATIEHRETDGQVAELQKELQLRANQVPLEMLQIESRAVTPAPGEIQGSQAPIEPYVFPSSVAEFLQIPRPIVATGEAIYPSLSGETTVHAPAKAASAGETTGGYTAEKLSPARLQASFFFNREDAASFPGMSDSLRSTLSEALSDGLDKQILVGAGGLLTGLNLTHVAAAARTKYAGYRAKLAYDHVDGRFANRPGDLRVVVGSATYADIAGSYGTDIGLPSALEGLTTPSVLGGLRVSAHVAAVDADSRQFAVVRRGSRRDAVAPIWQGITLIPDEITLAATGQIKITAVMLHAVKILRAAGFAKVQVQHA